MSYSIERRNPYIIGRPITEPDRFFGRDRLFEFIEDNLLQSAQVILLHGHRRIGKSSVLAQIPRAIDLKEFAFVPLSLEGDSRKSLAEVLHELSRDSVQQFDLTIQVPPVQAFAENPQIFIDNFIPALRRELGVKNIVLLLDEFDTLYNVDVKQAAEHLFGYLQTAVYDNPNLYIIPVVGRQLEDLPLMLSLFREAPNQEVGLLDQRSTEQLITIPAKGILEYDLAAIDGIWELTAGHPYFTQVVCFALFSNARTEKRWRVTRSDVRFIVDRAIELGEGGLGWFWEGIPLPERVVFSAAAEVPRARQMEFPEISSLDFSEVEPLQLLRECGVELTEPIRKALLNLVGWKLLRTSGVRSGILPGQKHLSMPPTLATYRVSIELVRRWLIQRHPVRREFRGLEDLNTEAQNLYEAAKSARLRGMNPKIVSLLNEVLRLNPNHFESLFELADSLAEMRQFGQALKYYKRAYLVDAVRVRDSYVQALLDYGEELHNLGETQDAIAHLEEALAIEPENLQIRRLLEQVRKEQQYIEHLRVIPITSQNRAYISSIAEMNAEQADLQTLQQNFNQLKAQVNAEAPIDLKNRALEHLNDLQEELFTQKKVDGLTLIYVYQWFRKHLPKPLVQAVTDFVDAVTATISHSDKSH
ncbi:MULTISPECIES: tetratricopeptide repeat protein [Leptolyngbya]|uniref:tetratricopeptide repeat protein n=1 Tax=Leptolyngbya TaxID=47251 RepID=UPI00168A3792|nr:tetratricopeptide repeat protein [Leptolyngbya sp. FACHB-1624]MBD1859652.1 AAA family ATPase [Leptolyngbya sp. FACHB-1624]